MIITVHTTINDLLQCRVFNQPAYNACLAVGFNKVGDILIKQVRSVARITHCTPKAIIQLCRLHECFSDGCVSVNSDEIVSKNRYMSKEDAGTLKRDFYKTIVTLTSEQLLANIEGDTAKIDTLRDCYSVVVSDMEGCVKAAFDSLYPEMVRFLWEATRKTDFLKSIPVDDIKIRLKIRELASRLLYEASSDNNLDDDGRFKLRTAGDNLDRWIPYYNALDMLDGLDKQTVKYMVKIKNTMFNKMSEPVQRTLRKFNRTAELLELIYSPSYNDSKNREAIESFLIKFKSLFEALCESFYNESCSVKSESVIQCDLKCNYSFLYDEECDDIAYSVASGNPLPMLQLYYKHILRNRTRDAAIFREIYGFNDSRTMTSRDMVADKFQLSNERLRQIIARPYSRFTGERFVKALQTYLGLSAPVYVISENSSIWQKWRAENNLDLSSVELMRLVQTAYRCLELIKMPNGIHYLIKGGYPYVKYLEGAFRDFETQLSKPRKDAITINLASRLQISHNSWRSHGDIKARTLKEFSTIFEESFLKSEYVIMQDYLQFKLLPNAVNRPKELEKILAENGTPMSAKEISRLFYEKFPDEPKVPYTKITYELRSNKNIIGKGLSGVYSLRSWNAGFNGTITELLHNTLIENKYPMTVEELTEIALVEFPNTSVRSVAALLSREVPNRFIGFENKKYGASNRKYPSRFKMTRLTLDKIESQNISI